MCWKQEWAHAINNMQKAIEHVEKAHDKLNKRLERNEVNLEKCIGDKFEIKKIKKRIEKNTEAIEGCKQIIESLKINQNLLFMMIHLFGISHSEDPKRVYKLMGNYPFAEKLKEYEYGDG